MPRNKRSGLRSSRSRTITRNRFLKAQRLRATFEPLEIRRMLNGGGLFGGYYDNMTLTGNPTNTRVDGPIDFNWNNTNLLPGVGPDEFSVRWTGQIQAPITQTYTFTTISNDGVRLWVNGEELINHWNSHPADVDSGSITLTAGENYNIEMDYFQNTGSGTAVLEWAGPGQTAQPIPAQYLSPQSATSAPDAPTQFIGSVASANEIDLSWQYNAGGEGAIIQRSTDGVNFTTIAEVGDSQASTYADTSVAAGSTYFYQVIDTGSDGQSTPSPIIGPLTTPGTQGVTANTNGLLGIYYTNVNFTSPTPVVVVDPQINFSWNSSSPAPGVGNSNYSVQWTGQLLAPVSGAYSISTMSDDGVRMWLGSQEIINDFTDHAATVDSAQVSLIAGQQYNIAIQYFNDDAPGLVQLAWTVPGQSQTIIPTSQLTPMAIAIPAPVPTAPTNLTATASTNSSAPSVSLSWLDVPSETGFVIERSTDDLTFAPIGTTAAGVTTYADNTAAAGTTYYYQVQAVNAAGDSLSSNTISSTTLPAPTQPTGPLVNLALNQPTFSSSNQNSGLAASYATDGNLSTRWSSAFADPQWIYVDLGKQYNISQVNLDWETASAQSFQIQVSNDAVSWTPIYSTTTGTGGDQTLTGLSGQGRYVRMYGTQRNTQYGYSLYEFQVFGTLATSIVSPPAAPASLTATPSTGQIILSWPAVSTATSYDIYRSTISGSESATPLQLGVTGTTFTDSTITIGTQYFYEITAVNAGGQGGFSPEALGIVPIPVNLALDQPTFSSSNQSSGLLPTDATDGNLSTRWSSAFADPQWIYVDLGKQYNISQVNLNWETASAETFQIQVSNDAVNWTPIYSTTTGTGGDQTLTGLSGEGRFVRMYGTQRNTQWGYSLYEFQVFGSAATSIVSPPAAPSSLTATPSSGEVTLSWPVVSAATSYDIYRGTTSGGESTTPFQTGVTSTTFTDTAVTTGTQYFYEVTAVNSNDQSGVSPEASATPPYPAPAAPTMLSATASIGQVVLSWPAAATASSYDIYRGTTSGGESATPFQTGITGTTFTDTAVTGGKKYFYEVTAVNSGGQSGVSPEASATVPIPPPTSPASLTATASLGQVVLSWSTVSAASSYDIYRGTVSGGESATPFQTGIAATTFTDTAVTAGIKYFYEVTAVDGGGQSGDSPQASATVPIPAPTTPASFIATPSLGQVALSWSAVSTAASYNIYRGTTSGGESTVPFQTGITATSFTDTAVTAGSSYFYEVSAVNSGGQSGVSLEASATVPIPPPVPSAPASLTATASNGQVTLSWSAVSAAGSYDIYRGSVSGGESSTPFQTGITTTSFTDTNVTAGSSYFYEVTTVNGGGQSSDSPEASATVPLPIPVTPAGVTAAVNSPSSISVSWLDEAYEAGFQVLESTDGVNYAVAGTTQAGVTGYTAGNLTPGQTYYFEIVATNSTGNSSASTPASATVPSSSSGFYGLTATPQPSEVLLAWPAQFQATSYNIFRGTSNGGESPTPIGTETGIITTFADTSAVAGTTYYYTVQATLQSGQTELSSQVSATPLAPVPSAPSTLLASALPSGILLNWSAVSGATSYNIFRGLSSGNESATPYQLGLTSTSFIDTAISGAGTYYYVVAGVNASGQGTGSAEVSARSPGITGLPAPTGLFATANSTGDITVSWQDVPGETGFEVLRSTDGVNFSQITTVGSGITNYADSGLNAGTTYYYQVIALGANGASTASASTSAVTQAAFDYTDEPAPEPSGGFTDSSPSGLYNPTTTQPNNIFYVGMPVTFTVGGAAATYQVRDYYGNLVDQGTALPTTTVNVTKPGWYKMYVYGNSSSAEFGNIVGTSTFVIFNNDPNFVQLTDLYDGGNYYFVDPAMSRVDPSINFNWSTTAPSPNMPLTEYGVEWTGQIQAQATQTYVFSTTSDDGVRLWVNNQEIINDWAAHASTNDFGSIALVAGQRYDIKLEYYQAQYNAVISLSWSSTTTPGVIIPPSVLYPTDASTTPGGLTGNYYIGLTSSNSSEDTVVHDVTGMGPERLNITDPSDPQAAIASVEADIQTDDALYVGQDAERPSGLLVSFTNGTSDLADIKTIVTALQGQVEYWEGQNEPDTGAYTGAGYVPVEEAFYNTIKSVNPNLQVLGPAAVSIVDDGAGLPWIQSFLAAGGGQYIDGLSFHGYDSNQGSLYQLREALTGLTDLMQQYGLGNMPLWQTEQGYPTAIYGSYQPEIQGQWTMLQMMTYEQFGIPKEHNVLWYDDSDGYWDIPDFWQSDDGTLLPAAALMDNWSQELYGTIFTQAYNFGSANNLYIGSLFTGPGKSVAAFMSAGQSNGSITLNVQGGSTLQVVDAFGNSTTIPVVNGQVTLTVPEEPVYVQMAPGQTINVVQQNWGSDLALQSGTTASYSGSSVSNNGINQIINGAQENWYWNGVSPWGTTNDTDQGANIQITLPQQETVSNVTIIAMSPWQLAGTLMDFDLQYFDSSNNQWITLDHVVQQPDTFGVYTPVDRTTVDSFFSNQYIFQNAFSPVTTQQIRLVINSVSYGGGATLLVDQSGGQASATPTLSINQVEIFG